MTKIIQNFRDLICLWFKIPEKIRYIFIGGFNFLVSYIMFIFLTFLLYGIGREFVLDIHTGIRIILPMIKINFWFFLRQFVLATTWFASSFISFATQRYLTFKSKGPIVKQYMKCLVAWFFGYIVNAIILEIMIYLLKFVELHPLLEITIAQFFANAFAAVSSYLFFKYFAFKKNRNKTN